MYAPHHNRLLPDHMPPNRRLVVLAILFLLLGLAPAAVPATSAGRAFASAVQSTYLHSGSSGNASSAIALDAQYMLVADDEDQTIRLYRRDQDGGVVGSTDFTGNLALTEIDNDTALPREVDLEASTRAGSRIYWIGSHSNGSIANGAKIRTNRYRLFASDLVGSGTNTTQTFVGYNKTLRTFSGGLTGGDLVAWGDLNGYDFSAKTVAGVGPEAPGGFNIEGLAMAPNGTTAYIAFRAPLIGPNLQALIAPLTNIDAVVTTPASPTFGAPILLDLGGRGIRSIERNSAGEYLIIAGPPEAGKSFQLYSWTGNAADAPVNLNVDMAALNPEGSFEGIVEVPAPLCGDKSIQLLVDNGDLDTGVFRTITIANPCPPTVTISSPTNGATFTQGQPITFTGTATDAQDGDKTASLTWSYAGGAIGSGGSFVRSDLPPGTHTISASVTDSGGLSDTKQIVVTITAAANTAPTVTISSPTNGATFTQGQPITFTGTATDAQDGDRTASLTWSYAGGAIGSGGSFVRSDLPPGTHTISAIATDTGGLSDTKQVVVTITAAAAANTDLYLPLLQR